MQLGVYVRDFVGYLKLGTGGGGVLAGQWRGCWLKFCIERKHTMCSLSVKYVRCLLVSSSSSMAYSVVLLCETVVDPHARPVGEGGGVQRGRLIRVQHPDRQCTRQQN
jgi:hypothetical protein